MKIRTNWFFLALLGCSGCDRMLGVDGDYTTAEQGQGTAGSGGSTAQDLLGEIVQVAAGYGSTCARTVDGQVKCWGDGAYAQLGVGDLGNYSSRGTNIDEMGANLPFLDFGKGRTAVDIATNALAPYACAVLDDGSISCWGEQVAGWSDINLLRPTSVSLPSLALKVTVGHDHACALLASGGVLCWGSNGQGQFGNGEAPNSIDYIPPKNENEVNLGMGRSAKAVAAGYSHTCVLLDNGTVKCWGWSYAGALGLANTLQILTPSTSPAIDFGGKKVLAISTGIYHVCALLDDKSVSCWGWNTYGGLGVGDTAYRQTPVTVPLGQPVQAITAGSYHTCAILDNDAVKCWGLNTRGQLGLGHWNNTLSPTGVADLGTGLRAVQLAGGAQHTCAVLQNSTIKCWGLNFAGALGIGMCTDSIGDKPNEMGDNLPNVLFF